MIGPEVGLSALLKLTGATQLELSQHLGVNRSTLASWLSGYAPMPDEVIVKIHKFVSARLSQPRRDACEGIGDAVGPREGGNRGGND